ncbi:MAG: YdcF family protein [Bacteroidetes bacterium]|nr:YdcF family protein [Bacteroidota bacterium]MBU1717686.1 YdcF family protein [Bacteroidota bacterium]
MEEVLRNNEFPAIPLSEVPDSMDVVIVLSGGMAAGDPAMERINFRYNTDRFLQALNLYKKGKAKKIMISGGDAGLISQGDIESHLLAEYFITLGIPESDIIIEDKSANTHENAKYSTEILKEMYPNGRFILITSASHLLRAYACFRKEGLNPLPYSVDRQTGKRKYTLDHLILPSPEALDHWDKLIHEWVGVFMYSVVGYI